MADERCVFPGDTPAPPGGWLDRRTAELLLRGESLEAVDAAARDQAERLAKTLHGLTVEPPPSSAELPGEAAALAAFRTARSGARAEQAAAGRHRARPHAGDAGLVRIGGYAPGAGRSRWSRSARFGLTAVLAVGMAGGVAFAATTGVLPTPFGGDEPGPAASVSAGVNPNRPLLSPSPNGPGEPTPDGSTGGSTDPATPSAPAGGGASAEPGSDDNGGRVGGWWLGAPSACREVRDGKELSADRLRALEGAAGGSNPRRVWKYCKKVLAITEGTAQRGTGNGKNKDRDGKGQDDSAGQGGYGDQDGQSGDQADQGDQGGDDDGNHIAPGGIGGAGTPTSLLPLLPKQLLTSHTPSPSAPSSTL